ncbi:dihydrodipicolinate synthase family protein [Herbiconiux sp. VKM Ac-1786]|uniref:dihydrodipicolinate synthase family protein n=1 Tax=Herbiconiux sp. VKM Ac-1786 TaxID=2783824 RepID=UPI00188AE61D|nr:dihydrodipicolinate synthase family protein [Herbiconiux sp. VKM Ac-1786]MBF4571800.1 dihydrodipicolinate synthase family protein [Herbiconiux sp. VKM Ac-1786]
MPSPAVAPEILTAVPVAFRADGSLNEEGSREILQAVARSGVQGALVLGTTGEFPALSERERGILTEIALEELSELRAVVHVGAASQYEVSRLIEQARAAGAREIAILTPYYLPTTPSAILEFYRTLADQSDGLDAYVYLFRDRTSNDVSEELLAQIAELPNIVGVKLSGESLEQVARFRAAVPADFLIYTGGDRDLARAHDFGAQGVISGVASVFAGPFVRLREALVSGNSSRVAELQHEVDAAVDLVRGDPLRMKAILRLQGIDAGHARMALDEPTDRDLADFAAAIPRFAALV